MVTPSYYARMSSLLTDLVRKQTAASVVTTLSGSIDRVAEEMAQELMRDLDFRAQLQQLMRAAFLQPIKELNQSTPPAPPAPEPTMTRAEIELLLTNLAETTRHLEETNRRAREAAEHIAKVAERLQETLTGKRDKETDS